MVHVEESVIINRPVGQVFAYATDIEQFPVWAALVHEVEKPSDEPMQVGMRFRTVTQLLGRSFSTDQEITEYEPNRKVVSKALSGPVRFVITNVFEPVNGSTRLIWAIEGESEGFFNLADPLLVPIGRRQIQAQLGTLKDLLEMQPAEKG